MKPLREFAALQATLEQTTRAKDFAKLAACILRNDGKLANAAGEKWIGVRFGKPLCKMLIRLTAAKAGLASGIKSNAAIRSRRLISSSEA